jgi:hypothetical protein
MLDDVENAVLASEAETPQNREAEHGAVALVANCHKAVGCPWCLGSNANAHQELDNRLAEVMAEVKTCLTNTDPIQRSGMKGRTRMPARFDSAQPKT